MRNFNAEYRVLGYASSELQPTAEPFLVILKLQEQMRGYLLRNWQIALGCRDPIMAMYVDDIINEVRNRAPGWREEAEILFDNMGELSVGPLRTVSCGLSSHDVVAVDAELSTEEIVVECSPDMFQSFLEALETR